MNEKQTNTEVGAGLDTPAGYATTDLTAVGEGRNTVVRLNLDRAGDSVTGQTVVDPKVSCKSPTIPKGGSDLFVDSVVYFRPTQHPRLLSGARGAGDVA